MPVTPEQTEWEGSPSIFAEDKHMMEVRMGRVSHPTAWSQAPMWGTSHVIGNVVIESESPVEWVRALAVPHDGAAPGLGAPLRRHVPPHARSRVRPAADQAAAGRHVQLRRRPTTTCCRSGSNPNIVVSGPRQRNSIARRAVGPAKTGSRHREGRGHARSRRGSGPAREFVVLGTAIAQSSPAYFCCIAVARIPPVLSSYSPGSPLKASASAKPR